MDDPTDAAPPDHLAERLHTIQRISGGRVADLAVAEIERYIRDNQLRAGHRLPPERVFIEQLGISRSSVREALRVLATTGRIEVRHGDGTYVAEPFGSARDEATRLFDATEEHALRNLIETRLGIELAASTAAAMRGTDDDFDRLERMLDDYERALRNDPGFIWEPLTFELAIIEITGNSWLHEVELLLREAWLSLSAGLRSSVARHNEWLAEHRAILASLRSRNVAQVQRMVIGHVSLERFETDLAGRHLPDRSHIEQESP
ncbi:MAG: FadR/GntR family transcriptional regulator [Ilumatobacteraceae bacterium]